MEKKTKELHYKRAVLKPDVRGTLQEHLAEVLTQIPLPKNRMEVLGINADERRVFLHERTHQSALCITMTTHEKDARQPIMGMSADSAAWPIKQCAPPELPDVDETTFLDGHLFLGVWKNHVIFLPSRSCGSEYLEDYLNFLLRKKSDWPDGAVVELDDVPPKEVREKTFKKVQAFKLGTTLGSRTVTEEPKRSPKRGEVVARSPEVMIPQEFGKTAKTVATRRFSPGDTTWTAIKQLVEMFGGKLPEDQIDSDCFNPDDITVKLEVRCSKRKLDQAGPVMDIMANSLRHVTSDLVRFEFEDGSVLKGKDLKTRKGFRLECVGSLPVVQQVDKAIIIYLKELIEKGTIPSDE